ncbi:MAG: hypothetical protein Q9217_005824 [Psora testacea]
MDPLSVIAGIAGIATAFLSTSKCLFELLDEVKNSPEEIKSLSRDAHAFYSVIFSLQLALKEQSYWDSISRDPTLTEMVRNLKQPLENCQAVLCQLMVKIQPHLKPEARSKRSCPCGTINSDRPEQSGPEPAPNLLQSSLLSEKRRAELYSAAKSGNDRVLRRLIAEAGILSTLSSGVQTLHIVISYKQETSASILVDHITNIQTKEGCLMSSYEMRDQQGRTPLIWAVRHGWTLIVRRLLDLGANVDAVDNNGRCALHEALKQKHEAIAMDLIDAEADITIRDRMDWTPLHQAAAEGLDKVQHALIDRDAELNMEAKFYSDTLSFELEQMTPLHMASNGGHVRSVECLIAAGANLRARNGISHEPIHTSAFHGHANVVEALIDAGVLVDQPDGRSGATPLAIAIAAGQMEVVKIHFLKGANTKYTEGNAAGMDDALDLVRGYMKVVDDEDGGEEDFGLHRLGFG